MKEYLHIYLKYLTNMVEDSFVNHFSGEIDLLNKDYYYYYSVTVMYPSGLFHN